MDFKKINGKTYYISSGTNIGVYLFKDKYTLLIDTGNNNQQGRKISEVLEKNNMNIKYVINTHHHSDHSGGNYYVKENFPGSIIYTSEKEKVYIENDELFSKQLFNATPIKKLRKDFMTSKEMKVDRVINEGVEKINNEKFEIIKLCGHSDGQIGIATRDGVCFLADSVMSEEIIKKYKMPFISDIEKQLNTYRKILELKYDYYVLSHGEKIYNKENIKKLINKNKDHLLKYIDISKELLEQPKSREGLLEEIIILEEINVDFNEYHFLNTTIGAIITFLYEKEELNYQIENGKLYYYKK
ncbi:MAG: MBL fold metallo-hydrolase [Firmicutes bacterium]|nr:MBL fold metallo-hydrolase [Bacillota bacterium]